MRYILNSDGYIDEVVFIAPGGSIECKNNTCTEYTGSIPDGYDSLLDWHTIEGNNEKLNAWKIVDGNLEFDAERYEALQELYKEQQWPRIPITINGLPSGSGYEAYYYINLNMVWCSIYLTGAAYATGKRHVVATIDSNYAPARRTALAMDGLQDYAEVLKASISLDGEIGFTTSAAKESGSDMYISGWWCVGKGGD